MNKVTLKIDGMMCSMCEAHINDAIRAAVPEAKKVSSSHRKGESSFICDKDIDDSALKSAIENTGYTLVSMSSEPYKKKGLFG